MRFPTADPMRQPQLRHTTRGVLGVAAAAAIISLVGCTGTEDTSATPASSTQASALTTTATTTATTTDESLATTVPAPWPMPPEGSSIAVLGCSFTDSHARGYTEVSELDQLRSGFMHLDSLRLHRWADSDDRAWDFYDQYEPSNGYTAAWFQICLFTEQPEETMTDEHQAHFTTVINTIRDRSGDIPIYVSPSHMMDPDVDCFRGGFYAPDVAATLADWGAGNFSNVERGPDTGPLSEQQLEIDHCHLNDAGERAVGTQLVGFFDQ